jgi:TolB-like protein
MLPHLQRLNLLLAELKRRQVFRAAAVYAVVAWAVIEVTSTVLPIFLLPDWVVRAVVGVMVLGFPLVLVVAWAFDFTSEGFQRTETDRTAPPLHVQFLQSQAFRATLVLLVLCFTGAAGWVSWQMWLKPGALRATDPSEAEASLDPADLAVLYFDDFSSGGELEYLANGITEALIHELSRLEPLRVVSRNGVKPYRDPEIPVDSLARVLGVGSLVEGSVEGSEDRIGVTVQLVDGATGMHRLSERIQGKGDDILALRDDIVARAVRLVGQALGRELELRRVQSAATDGEAWELFQRGQHLREDADTLRWTLGDTTSASRVLVRADSLFGEAASRDPDWVNPVLNRGWVARTRAGLISSSATTRDPELLESGIRFAEEALRRDPGNPEALALRGIIRVDLFRAGNGGEDLEVLAREAEEDLRQAVQTDEGQAYAWVALAELLRERGEFQEASVAAQHALEADPFLINAEKEILFTLSQVWLDLGDIEKASRWTDEGRRRFPAEPSFPAAKLVILAGRGGEGEVVDTAYALMAQVTRDLGLPAAWRLGRLQVAAVLAVAGLPDSATAVVEDVRSAGTDGAYNQYFEANVRVRLGQYDRALDLLEAYLAAMPHRRAYIARDWWWEPLHSNPRFQRLVGAAQENPGG